MTTGPTLRPTLPPALAGAADDHLLSVEELLAATDAQIAVTIAALVEEQKRRALEGGDLDALANEAFEGPGFDRRGLANLPYLRDGLLICPGVKSEKSASSHDCTFVSVDDNWVWDHPDTAYTTMRQLPGQKVVRQTVAIIPAYEGMEIDVVHSTARSGPCQMKSARIFTVTGGILVETGARSRSPQGHL